MNRMIDIVMDIPVDVKGQPDQQAGEGVRAARRRAVAADHGGRPARHDRRLREGAGAALRHRIGEFEEATRSAGHDWELVDATGWFAEWMAADDYRDAYFEDPELLGMKLEGEFRDAVARRLSAALETAGDNTVVGLLGAASLYGFLRVSELIQSVEPSIRGRLAVFFPGTKNDNNYRLLDARDGWSYLAQPITLHEAWVP